ncbi:MAG: TIR domain-containing protein [bacterium]|nr:TIR domain-containing protein [bacterium]
MADLGYRIDAEEAGRLRRTFSWFGFYVALTLNFVMSVLFIYGLVKLAWRIVDLPFRLLLARRTEAYVARLEVNPALGSSWYFWTYATFVSRKGKHRTFKLTPHQAVAMVVLGLGRDGTACKITTHFGRLVGWRRLVPLSKQPPRAFLSYPHARKHEAELIYHTLKSVGIDAWLDEEELTAGDSLPDKLQRNIRESHCFVPILSSEYFASKWCIKELELASAVPDLLVQPVRISADLHVPDYIAARLELAGDPLMVDIDKAGGLDELRAFSRHLVEAAGDSLSPTLQTEPEHLPTPPESPQPTPPPLPERQTPQDNNNHRVLVACSDCGHLNRIASDRLDDRPGCERCRQLLFKDTPAQLAGARIEPFMNHSHVPVVLAFKRSDDDWQGMATHFDAAASALLGESRLGIVDLDEDANLAQQCSVETSPTLVLFDRGVEVRRAQGSMRASEIIGWARPKRDRSAG